MTIERAIEILDPNHREHYDDIETVNEACRMGMEALEKTKPQRLCCEKCGKEIDKIDVSFAKPDGAERTHKLKVHSMGCDLFYFQINNLLKEGKQKSIRCPHCGEYPFDAITADTHEITRTICSLPLKTKEPKCTNKK